MIGTGLAQSSAEFAEKRKVREIKARGADQQEEPDGAGLCVRPVLP
jgi:hypothetical protein